MRLIFNHYEIDRTVRAQTAPVDRNKDYYFSVWMTAWGPTPLTLKVKINGVSVGGLPDYPIEGIGEKFSAPGNSGPARQAVIEIVSSWPESYGYFVLDDISFVTADSQNGVEFFPINSPGVSGHDLDGDSCTSRVFELSSTDPNDFIRVSPNGKVFWHIAEKPAEIVFVEADGTRWYGDGQFTLNAGLKPNLEPWEPPVIWNAIGRVTNSKGDRAFVNCNYKMNRGGKIVVREHTIRIARP